MRHFDSSLVAFVGTLVLHSVLGVNLVNIDVQNCGAGDSQQCSNLADAHCCDKVPRLGIQSTRFAGLNGKLHGVLSYNEDANYKCGAEQYAIITLARNGCLNNKGYTVYGGSAYVSCKAAVDCYVSDIGSRSNEMSDAVSEEKKTRASRFRLKGSVKPDIYTTKEGQHYFINGVIRNDNFNHITPMTEKQTAEFFEDMDKMSRDELYEKWKDYAVQSTKEIDEMVYGEKDVGPSSFAE